MGETRGLTSGVGEDGEWLEVEGMEGTWWGEGWWDGGGGREGWGSGEVEEGG